MEVCTPLKSIDVGTAKRNGTSCARSLRRRGRASAPRSKRSCSERIRSSPARSRPSSAHDAAAVPASERPGDAGSSTRVCSSLKLLKVDELLNLGPIPEDEFSVVCEVGKRFDCPDWPDDVRPRQDGAIPAASCARPWASSSREWRRVDLKAGDVRLDAGTTKNGDGRVFPFTTALRRVLEDQRALTDALQKEKGSITPACSFTRGARRLVSG